MHLYGWNPSLTPPSPDQAFDKFLSSEDNKEIVTLSESIIDWREYCSPVENQQDIGSCVANAIVSNLEFLEIKAGYQYVDLSRMFLYYNARLETNTTNQDKGSNIPSAFATLKKHGVCSEGTYSYDPSRVFMRPSWKAYQEAFRHTLTQSYKIDSSGNKLHYNILTALRSCHPVVFGTEVWNEFRSCKGVVAMPDTSKPSIGLHAMLIVGVDLNKNQYLVRNSWGTGWGDGGYCYFPFEYFDSINTFEFWTATKTQEMKLK